MLYFAYGSNLSLEQMRERCPQAEPWHAVRVPGWRLTFRTYADIEHAPGEAVHGALYRVTRSCLLHLDRFEGVGKGAYSRHLIRVDVPGFGPLSATTYINQRAFVQLPAEAYVAKLQAGYEDWRLPQRALRAAVRRARLEHDTCRADALMAPYAAA